MPAGVNTGLFYADFVDSISSRYDSRAANLPQFFGSFTLDIRLAFKIATAATVTINIFTDEISNLGVFTT